MRSLKTAHNTTVAPCERISVLKTVTVTAMKCQRALSNSDFIINVVNCAVGVGILAKPYALVVSGNYCAISVSIAFAFVVYGGILWAALALRCCDVDPDSADRDKSAYRLIGHKAYGRWGEFCIALSVSISITLIIIVLIIMAVELLSEIVAHFIAQSDRDSLFLSDGYIFLHISVLMMPLIFVLNWKQLTFMGTLSVASIAVIFAAVIYCCVRCLSDFGSFPVPPTYFAYEDHSMNSAMTAIREMDVVARISFSFMIFKNGFNAAGAIPVCHIKTVTFADLYVY